MYRNMRLKLLQELENNKQADAKHKMDEINKKIAALEKASMSKEEKQREMEKLK